MKTHFYEFYNLPDEKVNSIWDNGLLIVDTNVLLDLYRLGKRARTDLKKSISLFKDRLWIPYQVGLEFHRNRRKVIDNLGGKQYREFDDLVDKVIAGAKGSFKSFQKHPVIQYDYVVKAFDKLANKLKQKNDTWRSSFSLNVDSDDVLAWITSLYNRRVGDDYSPEELINIYKDGAIRYHAHIPPGYNDNQHKDGERDVYGDLIIWLSVIQKAKKDKVDVLFLTNDVKDDWFEKNSDRETPRHELLREFHSKTGQDILIMTEASFLKEINRRQELTIDESTIEDAELAPKSFPPYYWDILESYKDIVTPITSSPPQYFIPDIGTDYFPYILDVNNKPTFFINPPKSPFSYELLKNYFDSSHQISKQDSESDEVIEQEES